MYKNESFVYKSHKHHKSLGISIIRTAKKMHKTSDCEEERENILVTFK